MTAATKTKESRSKTGTAAAETLKAPPEKAAGLSSCPVQVGTDTLQTNPGPPPVILAAALAAASSRAIFRGHFCGA